MPRIWSPKLGAEAYAPVDGDEQVKAAIYNYDKSTGKVNVAFRILRAPVLEFGGVVAAVSKQLNEPPRYASTGAIMRAVWSSGAFVAADASKISLGWSHLVPALYERATPIAASN